MAPAPQSAATQALAAALAAEGGSNATASRLNSHGTVLQPGEDRFDVDMRAKAAEPQLQLQVTPITVLKSDVTLQHVRNIAVSPTYICYSLKLGQVRVLNQLTGSKALLREHSCPVSDMDMLPGCVGRGGPTDLLASVDVSGRLLVRKLYEGPAGASIEGPLLLDRLFPGIPATGRKLAWRPQGSPWSASPPGSDPHSPPGSAPVLAVATATGVVLLRVSLDPAEGGGGIQEVGQPQGDEDGSWIGATQGGATLTSVAWSSDGVMLVVGDSEGYVYVWACPCDQPPTFGNPPPRSFSLPEPDIKFRAFDPAAPPSASPSPVPPHHDHSISLAQFVDAPQQGLSPTPALPSRLCGAAAAPEVPYCLVTGNSNGRVLKLWVLDLESKPACSYTLTLTSSNAASLAATPGGGQRQPFFNHALVPGGASGLVLLANACRSEAYALHAVGRVAAGSAGGDGAASVQYAFDCITAFAMKMPVLSLTTSETGARSEEPALDPVQLYCVQSDAIQNYTLLPEHCLPSPEARAALDAAAATLSVALGPHSGIGQAARCASSAQQQQQQQEARPDVSRAADGGVARTDPSPAAPPPAPNPPPDAHGVPGQERVPPPTGVSSHFSGLISRMTSPPSAAFPAPIHQHPQQDHHQHQHQQQSNTAGTITAADPVTHAPLAGSCSEPLRSAVPAASTAAAAEDPQHAEPFSSSSTSLPAPIEPPHHAPESHRASRTPKAAAAAPAGAVPGMPAAHQASPPAAGAFKLMPMTSFRKQQAEGAAAAAALEASAAADSAAATTDSAAAAAAGGGVQASGGPAKGAAAGPAKAKKLLTRQAASAASTGGPAANGSESSTHTGHPGTAAPIDQAADSARADGALLANFILSAAAAQAARLERQSAVTGDGGGSSVEGGAPAGTAPPSGAAAGAGGRASDGSATAAAAAAVEGAAGLGRDELMSAMRAVMAEQLAASQAAMALLREEVGAVARQGEVSLRSALRRAEEERRGEDRRALQEWKAVLAAAAGQVAWGASAAAATTTTTTTTYQPLSPPSSYPHYNMKHGERPLSLFPNNQACSQMSKDTAAAVTAVGRGSAAALPGVVRSLMESSLPGVVQRAVAEVLPAVIGGDLMQQALSRSLSAQVERCLALQLQSSLPKLLSEGLRESFSNSVVPAFERATQAMFGQVQAAFESGLIGALGSSSAAHTAGAAALSEAVTRVSSLASTMQGELLEGQRAIIVASRSGSVSGWGPTGGQSRAVSVADLEARQEPKVVVSSLLQGRRYQEAFSFALGQCNLELTGWCCSAAESHNLMTQDPCPLEDDVLLSLIQQLTSDLRHSAAMKLSWTCDALLRLTEGHGSSRLAAMPQARPMLEMARTSLSSLAATSTDRPLVRQARMALPLLAELMQ
ncbi:MAG: hypothetical protein WDW36_000627 [Sanguina aurantia]